VLRDLRKKYGFEELLQTVQKLKKDENWLKSEKGKKEKMLEEALEEKRRN
jgi:hypothetical protein